MILILCGVGDYFTLREVDRLAAIKVVSI